MTERPELPDELKAALESVARGEKKASMYDRYVEEVSKYGSEERAALVLMSADGLLQACRAMITMYASMDHNLTEQVWDEMEYNMVDGVKATMKDLRGKHAKMLKEHDDDD